MNIKSNKSIALLFCCMSTFLINMDNTIINVALPSIKTAMKVDSISGLQWIVDSYLIVLASCLILGDSLGDRFGRKLVYQIGLIIFGISSFLIVFSVNLSWMICLRVVQAIGAAMLNPNAMALISNIFQDKQSKAKAFAIWGSVVGLGMASGPLIGGPLVEFLGWNSIFYINLPLSLLVIIGTQISVPNFESNDNTKFDIWGQCFILISLFSLIFLLIEIPQQANNLVLIVSLIIFIISTIVFILIERFSLNPVLEISLFKNFSFTAGIIISIINYLIVGGILFITVIHLQNYLHFSAIKTGLYTAIIALMTAISAQLSGILLRKYGYVIPILLSGLSIIIGALAYIMLIVFTLPNIFLLVAFFFFGIGFGGINTPVNTIIMSGAGLNRSGVAGAIASSSRQFGQSLGVAIFGEILSFCSTRLVVNNIDLFLYAVKIINYFIVIMGFSIIIIVWIIKNMKLFKYSSLQL